MNPVSKNTEPVHIMDEDENGGWHLGKATLPAAVQGDTNAPIRRRSRLIFGTLGTIRSCTSIWHDKIFPDEFWSVVMKDLNGCFRYDYREEMDHDSELWSASPSPITDTSDTDGNLSDSWLCFKIKHVEGKPGICYEWRQMTIFIRWDLRARQHLILFLDWPDNLKQRLLKLPPSTTNRTPYAWYAIFVREALQLYDGSIWALRDIVREVERSRKADHVFDFPQFHDLARHIIHSNETLDVAERTVQSVINEQTRLRSEFCSENSSLVSERDRREMLFMLDQLHALKARSQSLNERLKNEINLAFNIVAQLHSKSAQTDSAVMKTIGIVSLIYLPGMFISSIFGMNFFDQQNDRGTRTMSVSQDFWLYWSITIPLTAVTIMVWAMWHYHASIMRALGR